MPTLIVIIYDGISNSVFQSQVVAPLLARKANQPELDIHLISFERDHRVNPPHIPGITCHIFKRFPFIHRLFLSLNVLQLRFFLHRFDTYEILARGPFAGYISYHAANTNCPNIIIQARGLVAEEYRYTRGAIKLNRIERYRYAQFLNLENTIYGTNRLQITFQAVSPALKEYMITTFKTKPERITIAQADIPAPISPEQKELYRRAVRTELNITHDAQIYCYSGSYKPWQCPQETIAYFKNLLSAHPHAFLLILTPDVAAFQTAIAQAALPIDTYRIYSAAPDKLCSYLAAADFGLLLREKHVINFVSRPTKALEYQAAGLTIIHNDTVAYLKNFITHETPHPEQINPTSLQNRTFVSDLQGSR